MGNPKLLKVTLEFDDEILTIEGEEAQKWDDNCMVVALFASSHQMNAFDQNPVNWQREVRQQVLNLESEVREDSTDDMIALTEKQEGVRV